MFFLTSVFFLWHFRLYECFFYDNFLFTAYIARQQTSNCLLNYCFVAIATTMRRVVLINYLKLNWRKRKTEFSIRVFFFFCRFFPFALLLVGWAALFVRQDSVAEKIWCQERKKLIDKKANVNLNKNCQCNRWRVSLYKSFDGKKMKRRWQRSKGNLWYKKNLSLQTAHVVHRKRASVF